MSRELVKLALATMVMLSLAVSVGGASTTTNTNQDYVCHSYNGWAPTNLESYPEDSFADYADTNGDCYVSYWEALQAALSLNIPTSPIGPGIL